jgi:hypothetical protein
MKVSEGGRRHGSVYRVRAVDGSWQVFDRAERGVSERTLSQADAVVHAKELARDEGSAQIIVHDRYGNVVSEFVYQREERPSLAYDDSAPSTAASHPAKAGAVEHDPRGRGGR